MSSLPPLSGAILIANPSKERIPMARSLANRGRPLRRARKYAASQKRRGKKVGLYSAFEHVLGKRGFSKKTLRRLYKARRAGKTAAFPKSRRSAARKSRSKGRAKSRSTSRRAAAPKRKLSSFARFMKLNKGRGWRASEMSVAYHAAGKKAVKMPEHYAPMGPNLPWNYSSNTVGDWFQKPEAKSWWSSFWPANAFGSSSVDISDETTLAPAQAAANGLALALQNGLALTNPMHIIATASAYAIGTAVPAVGTFYAMNYGVPVLKEHVYDRVSDLVEKVPVVGAKTAQIIDAAPHAITGSIVGGVIGLGAVYSLRENLPWQVSAVIGTIGLIAPVIGFYQDWPEILDAVRTPADGSSDAVAGLALDMNGLALENMGGLALENMGALALEAGPFGNALGDGMAYETAPLTAANVYAQASLADASSCGADFDVAEGTAILNGTWGSVYGAPPVRQSGRVTGESHLARRPGHRWGWLIKLVGWDRARQIAALEPKKRVKLIAKLRAQAVALFRQEVSRQDRAGAASLAEFRVQTVSPAGGLPTSSAPAGASGPSGAGAELGAPLFLNP